MRPLGLEAETLVNLIGHYRQHPEARRELGTYRAVERFDEIVRAGSPVSG